MFVLVSFELRVQHANAPQVSGPNAIHCLDWKPVVDIVKAQPCGDLETLSSAHERSVSARRQRC